MVCDRMEREKIAQMRIVQPIQTNVTESGLFDCAQPELCHRDEGMQAKMNSGNGP